METIFHSPSCFQWRIWNVDTWLFVTFPRRMNIFTRVGQFLLAALMNRYYYCFYYTILTVLQYSSFSQLFFKTICAERKLRWNMTSIRLKYENVGFTSLNLSPFHSHELLSHFSPNKANEVEFFTHYISQFY